MHRLVNVAPALDAVKRGDYDLSRLKATHDGTDRMRCPRVINHDLSSPYSDLQRHNPSIIVTNRVRSLRRLAARPSSHTSCSNIIHAPGNPLRSGRLLFDPPLPALVAGEWRSPLLKASKKV